MKAALKYIFILLTLIFINDRLLGQEKSLHSNYIGVIPSILIEPYDTINAVEVNALPIVYEFRLGEKNDIGVQLRPILNYRFFEDQSGFSQMGGSTVINKYFLQLLDDNFWLKPQLAVYYTYAYNQLDMIQTMTLGIEPGAYMTFSNHLSLSLNLQPGINYYPNQFSKEFVNSENGFKPHFGIIFHIGYNF